MKNILHLPTKAALTMLAITGLMACTSGHIEYVTAEGEHKTACKVEYTWAPSVDKYAVEYILSYCAQQATKQGHKVVDKALLTNDLTISPAPTINKNTLEWTHSLAEQQFNAGKLTNKEYGYLIAYLDLGHNKPKNTSGNKLNNTSL